MYRKNNNYFLLLFLAYSENCRIFAPVIMKQTLSSITDLRVW